MKYPIERVDDVFGASSVLADVVRQVTGCDCPRVLLVADGNVVQRTAGLGTKIGRYLTRTNLKLAGPSVILSGGERVKADGLKSLQLVLAALVPADLSADGCVLALGGGSVLDVALYAAAQVAGTRVVRIPTTPSALFDAAFAPLAALDCEGVKDALTLVAEPDAVVLDACFSATVLDGVWRAGFGEAVRLAAACDAKRLKELAALAPSFRQRAPEALSAVLDSVTALRRGGWATDSGLNTAARLEEMSGFKLPHGYAVAIAVALEACYAAARGLLATEDAVSLRSVLAQSGALDGLEHSQHLLDRGEILMDVDFEGVLYQRALDLLKYTP